MNKVIASKVELKQNAKMWSKYCNLFISPYTEITLFQIKKPNFETAQLPFQYEF